VSTLEPRKAQTQILAALDRLWADGHDVNLVLVGQAGWKIESLITRLDSHPEKGNRLFWLRGISDEYLELVYKSSTCLVAASINEGFGLPLIEAARHGIPIVARDIPIFKEVAGSSAHYFSGETGEQLALTLVTWLELNRVGQAPTSQSIRWSTWQQATVSLKFALFDNNYERRQLFLDISQLIEHDARTGIQRVVRALLKEIIENPPKGYRVEPVFATVNHGYRYASSFSIELNNRVHRNQVNESIEFAPGDLFFGLDLDHHAPRVHQSFLKDLRKNGVTVIFMVYDLLPIQFPRFWDPIHQVERIAEEWLTVVASQDGAICISESVAEELHQWIKLNNNTTKKNFSIKWFHLGADIKNSLPTNGMPDNAFKTLEKIKINPSFLMVGTLEPRKGHSQVLGAFEKLWDSGHQINLVIVGKEGWMVEDLLERMQNHYEYNNRLFWLRDISDEYLEHIYGSCTCLIAASYGEGFGLPLIEAAQHKLPIIARDIPVFREVAGEHAYYFASGDAEGLALSITDWQTMQRDGTQPNSSNMPWLTWRESSKNLTAMLTSHSINN
jgi:glycosyltransferase involved in cell wall biosynthesis